MAKVIDGALSTDFAGNKFLLAFEQLECVISETILQLFDKAMTLLWLQGVNHNKELIFETDVRSYMVKAAKHLKMAYPRMIHITCMTHKTV